MSAASAFARGVTGGTAGETGQPDRCVYASVSQERRNLPELGRATSGLPGFTSSVCQRTSFTSVLCAATTILERKQVFMWSGN